MQHAKQSPPRLFDLVSEALTALQFIDALAEAVQIQAEDAHDNAISINNNGEAITARAHLDHVCSYQRLSDSLLSCLRTQVTLAQDAMHALEGVAP